ncbi:hypothetical protein [Methanospirillum lacunae]|nr:hypothetical protein [Methanospirillum lacunae]
MTTISSAVYYRFVLVFIVSCILVTNQTISASVFLMNGTEISQDQIPDIINTTVQGLIKNPSPLIFFYDYECQSCQQALDSVRYFEKRNPNARITYYDLGDSQKNRSMFLQYKSNFNTTKIRYPAIFSGEIVISGSSDIIHHIELFAKGYRK